ncbi:MAG: sortase domain-containing protein [Nocardioides sp.]|uniref:sortase domain-containing protein n=1 Tax=Nocardioides sp. TaxID=35761 RepID=UPI003D6AE165
MRRAAAAAAGILLLAGCSAEGRDRAPTSGATSGPTSGTSTGTSTAEETAAPTRTPSSAPEASQASPRSGPRASDGRARDARLSIPRLGIDGLQVVAYPGKTDDAEGTRIQDGGVAASPNGPQGGTGPGGIGNYQVTAHRLSSTKAFLELPRLRKGDRVTVEAGGTAYVYEITITRRTSFRDEQSLREQRAEVPGRPGEKATEAYVTLSTCRTIEDHDEGNFWADRFDNPEHRIDKIGVLVASRKL